MGEFEAVTWQGPYTKASVAVGAVQASGAVGHDWLHGAVGVLDRLGAVRVRDELRRSRRHAAGGAARRRLAVWVLGGLVGGSIARLVDGLRGHLPLGDARRELHVVVLLARAVPLGDPAGGQARGRKRGTLGAGGRRAGHGGGWSAGGGLGVAGWSYLVVVVERRAMT